MILETSLIQEIYQQNRFIFVSINVIAGINYHFFSLVSYLEDRGFFKYLC